MANERITEGIVRDHFKADALFKSIKWEEQKSGNKTISGLLKGQSKGDGKGNGYPEFIISFPTNSNYLYSYVRYSIKKRTDIIMETQEYLTKSKKKE